MTQEWTDGVALVRRDGCTVTVQILGDVWVTPYADEQAATLAYLTEVETERSRPGLPAAALLWLEECER
jgi:hypothetical protein